MQAEKAANSASSARRTRGIMARKMRAMFSARSTYRPSQKTLSATLLGTSRATPAQLYRLVARAQHAECIHRAVPQHPRVFAVAAPLHGDNRILARQRAPVLQASRSTQLPVLST